MRRVILCVLLATLIAGSFADTAQPAPGAAVNASAPAVSESRLIAGLRQALGVVESAGNFGFVLLLCFFFVVVCLSLPTTPIELSAGFMYGAVWGCAAGVIGKTVGSFIAYMIARTFGKSRGWKVPAKIESYMSALKSQPIMTMVGIRIAPLPLGLKNYGLALCGVDAVPYVVASVIVNTPFSMLWASLGAACTNLDQALNFDTSKVSILGNVPDWAKAFIATGIVVAVGFVAMRRMSSKPVEKAD